MYPKTATALLLIVLTATGCGRLGPDFTRPDISLNEAYFMAPATAVSGLSRAAWWQDLEDPVLTAMIARGLSQNLDILAAQERIVGALAARRGLGDDLSGEITAAGQYASTEAGSGTASDVGLDAGYVFDIFGGAARERERADATIEATVARAESVRLAWIAEISGAYIDALYQAELISLQRTSIENRQKAVEAIRTRIGFGEASAIDLSRAEALLNAARAEVPVAEGAREAAVFRIASLLNEASGTVRDQVKGRRLPHPPGTPRVGVPADLLRNRPDIRVAEADLKAATAAIGIAEADLMPSLRLGGSLSATARSVSLGPELRFPVFGRTALRSRRDVRISEAKSAEIAWRAAINEAIEQVDVAKTSLETSRRSLAAHSRAADSYRATLGILQSGFETGEVSVTELLAVEEELSETLKDAAETRRAVARQWVSLQISTGAGSSAVAKM